MQFTIGTRVTFIAEDGVTYEGVYQGIIRPYDNRFHSILVDGYNEPNWVQVGSERELTIKEKEG